MTYYDALITKWATLSPGTTEEKLAALNAEIAPGPRQDVAVSSVVGVLMLSGAYLKLASFAQGDFTGQATRDNALGAAKMLMAMTQVPNAPSFGMSKPANYAKIAGMLGAIKAHDGDTGVTGITNAVYDELLALAETTQPWWQATVAQGGGGLRGPVVLSDLAMAGLV